MGGYCAVAPLYILGLAFTRNSDMSLHFQHDVLVIGSGAAGLTLALTLPSHLRIAVLSKGDLSTGRGEIRS